MTPNKPRPANTGPILIPQVSKTATTARKINKYFNEAISQILSSLVIIFSIFLEKLKIKFIELCKPKDKDRK